MSNIKNMEDFAAVSGVSRPTISKYFNNPKSVRDATRNKIETALKKHHYRPNMYAINSNRRQTKNIGIVVPNLNDPFFASISRSMEALIIKAGYTPFLLSSHGGSEQEISNLDSLWSMKPAGVLLAPLGWSSDKDRMSEFTEEVPTILFDSDLEGVGEAFFGSDNVQSLDLILEYLYRTGEAPSFFEIKNPINPNALKRRDAYITGMKKLGVKPQLIQVNGKGWNFEEIGFIEGKRVLMEKVSRSNTFLCSNDRLAIGLLSAAFESGLKVGYGDNCDLRIAGHDDHPFCRFTCPSLTTIYQNYEAIAEHSVDAIINIIKSGCRPSIRETKLFEGKLIMRKSA